MNPYKCNHTRAMIVVTTDENKNKITKNVCAHCGLDLTEVKQVITNKQTYI